LERKAKHHFEVGLEQISAKRGLVALPVCGELEYYLGMKQVITSHYLLLSAILTVTAMAGTAVAQSQKVVKLENARTTSAWSGDQLYKEFCSSCHGVDGRGGGPAASALKANPTDLTQISRRNNSKFPEMKIRDIVNGTEVVTAHGNNEMPMWGNVFKSISANQTFGQMRIDMLVKYLESIQR
jgi:mono/diheme cytochrome c family protein